MSISSAARLISSRSVAHTRCALQASACRRTVSTAAGSQNSGDDSALSLLGPLDMRRMDLICHRGPADFEGRVTEVTNNELDWNKTIFHTMKNPIVAAMLKERFGKKPLWADSVISDVTKTAASLPGKQYHAPAKIRHFMATECEFKNEHADGGFDDHLDFCAEYAARYFPGCSPNVLFLHSICGVGTNLFPMDFDKLPQLEALLTPNEFLHVQAFPALQRHLFISLLKSLREHQAAKGGLGTLRGVTFKAYHGATLTLEGADFWDQLNYQLIHNLDFLPLQRWSTYVGDPAVRVFVQLHQLLRDEGKLLADITADRLRDAPGLGDAGA
eukprot:CAMPEP_0169440888 /NCGR_PEP_ID=MMETSP1042-20121227/7970_1 /TAXON_ID=464988 /ORGANISM="Hemiselmis andersenii, Strain CCMP1180" /LENGTH=328 /DNA_ID=CAMNT_0009551895 /DNA_START=64 /DNA_END=1046 /DNA_ORIENTATION=+